MTLSTNKFGNLDIRAGIPAGYAHVSGQRLGPICRAVGVEYVPAMVGWTGQGKYIRPKLDGVIVPTDRAEEVKHHAHARMIKRVRKKAKKIWNS